MVQIERKGQILLQYFSQFMIILSFSLVGEALQRLIPVSIPASVYGIVLLFLALWIRLVKVEQVKTVGGFLTSILPVFFVSPVVGILENWALIKGAVLVIFLLVAASTAATFVISGRITQRIAEKEEKRRG